MQNKKFSLGIDFGSTTARALLLDVDNGETIYISTSDYECGVEGVITDSNDPHLARQAPSAYIKSMESAVKDVIKKASNNGVNPENIIGIGTDATGSTPLPVNKNMIPIGDLDQFKDNPNAQAWMWKDHTSANEAAEITKLASEIRPEYLSKCGGAYSSEWFFSKILHCLRVDKKVFDTAYTWVEFSDFIPALLCGVTDADNIKRNSCAAGHKAMYNTDWNGLPNKEFLSKLEAELGNLHERLFNTAYSLNDTAGTLSKEWANKLGLKEGIPVAMGLLDAHMGAIGAGAGINTLVKIIGTSTCDIMVHPMNSSLQDIIGVAGVAKESVLPEYYGIEAGQSAVGDIFKWFVSNVLGKDDSAHKNLTEEANKLIPGESGLLALDWNNGNRNILTDPSLSGLVLGQTLHTKDFEIYRALIEATAFGAKKIVDQIEKYGVTIDKIVNCGGIAQKNSMFMQIYADVMNKPMLVSQNAETVAFGSAIAGAYAAKKGEEGFESIEAIFNRLNKTDYKVYNPNPENVTTYEQLYELYIQLHDSFGTKGTKVELFPVMKKLIELKQKK